MELENVHLNVPFKNCSEETSTQSIDLFPLLSISMNYIDGLLVHIALSLNYAEFALKSSLQFPLTPPVPEIQG